MESKEKPLANTREDSASACCYRRQHWFMGRYDDMET